TTSPHPHPISQLQAMLPPAEFNVVNDTRVLPARLHLTRSTGGRAEVLLLELVEGSRWRALARPGRKLRAGELLHDDGGREVVMVLGRDAEDDGVFIVDLMLDADALEQVGEMPLPPYITAPLRDAERYQTVYSRRAASAAAPTAGLHFTDELMANVEDRGARIERVDLVVGLDTFRP
ncbi:MAG: S-adenosylmethionine:tRNA ribosyltransferase-isomerase, partial [Ilumatobacter sp.]